MTAKKENTRKETEQTTRRWIVRDTKGRFASQQVDVGRSLVAEKRATRPPDLVPPNGNAESGEFPGGIGSRITYRGAALTKEGQRPPGAVDTFVDRALKDPEMRKVLEAWAK